MPTDPSGSLYLSRMADYSAAHPHGLMRRRFYRPPSEYSAPLDSTAQLDANKRLDPAEKAVEYDRALRLSRLRGASVLGQSRYQQPGASSLFQSTYGGGIAQTAILGDSQGSAIVSPPHPPQVPTIRESVIPEEDLMPDGGVGSMLGESYVDGRRPGVGLAVDVGQSQREEDEAMEDGGVLGLLAQIYGTGVNLKGRGRGPPRAI